ncbi:MAG: mannose-1-phosphate guanylyltransferase [Candidatus Omnitrophica bacterium]|nr:mannose-1-phosphate guanylyltransferase [Candidatus Omnitrophota bacterium]MBU1997473.1 mannose-1-phosphate guanylyltransferase [Candidatus Omnitrophota bacterium]MBU4333046.1 mannose-1-phosphate guanylyltransferase [Candidatus Omnitrophota bacterium]
MVNNNLYAVILAGGSGTRFWPLSRESRPKQYLNIVGEETLFQKSINRIKSRIASKNIFVVSIAAHKQLLLKQAAQFNIPKENFLLEPVARNTAPAICWAAASINKVNPNAVMAVIPSDHLITEQKRFLDVLDKAVVLANDDHLVTLGITPTRPETGYGYLKTNKAKLNGKSILKVSFKEKPSSALAKKYIKDKSYFWNSGMFIWKTAVILNEFKIHLPSIHKKVVNSNTQSKINAIYKDLNSISIDYGILERSKNVVALEAKNIGWSDLGSWESLIDVLQKNKRSNLIKGEVIGIDCENSFIMGNNKPIAAIGLDNIIIVDTPDALLVCQKSMSQRVREVVSTLKSKKSKAV